ncbi:MAG TPA: nucleotidyltransferase family protein [Planctomycetota bacterium]|nr:nucleotidyltransferase family protein [Planctomycetota bacterium]HRR81784.1 nucleotidyltransferase family protein [Planctomycetota bacterium]
MKVLLLAAGLGTRLYPLTETVPKCLVPVAGRPLLDYWFDRLGEAGLREVLINTHHLAGRVRAYIERMNAKGDFNISEAFEPHLLGSAGTIRANRGFADDAEHCLIVYADMFSDVDLAEFLRFHGSHGDPFTMMLFRASDPRACGIAELDAAGRVIAFEEKPRYPASNLANGGVYAVTADAYREIADMDRIDIGYQVLPAFVGRMRGWEWNGYHRDIGSPDALRRASADAPLVLARRAAVCTRTLPESSVAMAPSARVCAEIHARLVRGAAEASCSPKRAIPPCQSGIFAEGP